MSGIHNIYCDESCHLENDQQPIMVLGAIWCPLDCVKDISINLREIKKKHGLSSKFESKWTKISPAKIEFYLEAVNYFFDHPHLHFRGLIAQKGDQLDHIRYNQKHDDWYYKMYFNLLKVILDPSVRYRIYLDIKDTNSSKKVEKLHAVLSNSIYDFSQMIIERVQMVRSHEVEILQLTDLLIGAVMYSNRGHYRSEAKIKVVDQVKKRSNYDLSKTTLYRENKVNLFHWKAS